VILRSLEDFGLKYESSNERNSDNYLKIFITFGLNKLIHSLIFLISIQTFELN
jgi:hypothetical protein